MTPELQAKVNIWRHKAAEGTLTDDEMREAVIAMREGRLTAATATAAARTKKAAKVIPSANDLLSELGEL